jgi:hypothetical protein
VNTPIKLNKCIVLYFSVLLSNKSSYNILNVEFGKFLYNSERFILKRLNTYYKIKFSGFKTIIHNGRYIVLRSCMAFKKFGKEPYNNRRELVSFELKLMFQQQQVSLELDTVVKLITRYIEHFFYSFGGEVRTLRIGVLNDIKLPFVISNDILNLNTFIYPDKVNSADSEDFN